MSSSHSPPDPILSLSVSGLTPVEAFAKVDTEISRLEAQLLHLRHLRNTIPPIATLPDEILSEIFVHCHNADTDAAMQPLPKAPTLSSSHRDPLDSMPWCHGRLVLSWVSRHWRSVALSFSRLWAFITNGSIEHTEECIVRSRAHHLSICLQYPSRDLLFICLRQLDRVSQFRVKLASPVEDEDVYGEVWTKKAPHLISLYLEGFDFRTQSCFDPNPLFGGSLSYLHTLTLANCQGSWTSTISWTSPLLESASNLTSLSIDSPIHFGISMRALFEEVLYLPSLRHLELSHCLYSVEHPPQLTGPHIVSLPNLLTLVVVENHRLQNLVFSLLHQLDLPHASIHATLDQYYSRYGSRGDLWRTFRAVETYRRRIPSWGENAVHDISIKETQSQFCLTISPPDVSMRAPSFTLCLQHMGNIYQAESMDYHCFGIALWAVDYFPFFLEDLGAVSLGAGGMPYEQDFHQELLLQKISEVRSGEGNYLEHKDDDDDESQREDDGIPEEGEEDEEESEDESGHEEVDEEEDGRRASDL